MTPMAQLSTRKCSACGLPRLLHPKYFINAQMDPEVSPLPSVAPSPFSLSDMRWFPPQSHRTSLRALSRVGVDKCMVCSRALPGCTTRMVGASKTRRLRAQNPARCTHTHTHTHTHVGARAHTQCRSRNIAPIFQVSSCSMTKTSGLLQRS